MRLHRQTGQSNICKSPQKQNSDLHKASCLLLVACCSLFSEKDSQCKDYLGINITSVASESASLLTSTTRWQNPSVFKPLQTRCTTLLSVTTHFSTNTHHIPHSINLFVIFRSISRDTVICLCLFLSTP